MAGAAMEWRVLVTRAGTGATNNLIRGLRSGAPDAVVVGCHSDRFFLRLSSADRNYLIPPLDHPDLAEALRVVVEKERVDLIIPTTDDDVRTLSALRASLPCRVFLPAHSTIELCQDKYALAARLGGLGVPVPRTFAVTHVNDIDDLFERLQPSSRVWCRIR